MLGKGFFIGSGIYVGEGNSSDVIFKDGKILYSPSDNIYVDEDNNVFYSEKNANAFLSINDSGNVVVKVVN